MTKYIKYLPGDFLTLGGRWFGNEAVLITGVKIVNNSVVYSYYFTSGLFIESTTGDLEGIYPTRIKRLFRPDINYLCYNNRCAILQNCGGCFDCEFKYEYHDPEDRVYYPGDVVYSSGKLLVIDKMFLFPNIALSIPTNNLEENYLGFNRLKEGLEIITTRAQIKYGCHSENGTAFVDTGISSEFIRLRKRGGFYSLRPDLVLLCDKCIYVGTDKCKNCITNKIICQIPEKNL